MRTAFMELQLEGLHFLVSPYLFQDGQLFCCSVKLVKINSSLELSRVDQIGGATVRLLAFRADDLGSTPQSYYKRVVLVT